MMRQRLPNTRHHEAVAFEFRGLFYTLGIGRFDDGRIAEIFIDPAKPSCDDISNIARDAAVILSIALQYGADIEAMRSAVTRDAKGEPAGLVGAVLDKICGGAL